MLADTAASRSASVATPAAAQWDVIGAICLERKPLIAPPLTPIEQQMSDTIARLDYITSLKSNHELRQDEEKYVSTPPSLHWFIFAIGVFLLESLRY